MIVLDASAAFELLLRTSVGAGIAARLNASALVHAPQLLDVEIASSLRRGTALKEFSAARARQALNDLRIFRIQRHPHLPYIERIWELRHNFTAYDACYLALTEALDATLLTRDTALAQAHLRRGEIEVV